MRAPRVVILSAGRGFRLNPLTLECPKSLCTIASVSLLRRQLDLLSDAGIGEATLVLPMSFQHLKSLPDTEMPANFDLNVVYLDPTDLGQVGIVRQVVGAEDGSVLVIYGDSLLKADFGQLLITHKKHARRGAVSTILYHQPADLYMPEKDGRTYHGVLSVREDGFVTRFKEKPEVSEISPGFNYANAAVFVIERGLLARTEFANATNFSFDIFEPAVSRALPVFATDIGEGFRYDIGGFSRWYELNLQALTSEIDVSIPHSEVRPSVWIGGNCRGDTSVISPPTLVGCNVTIQAGARIGPYSIVGDGCCIGSNAVVERSIIMDHSTIGYDTHIESCVIGRHSRIGNGVRLPKFTCIGAFSTVGNDSWPNWAELEGFDYR